MVILECRPKMQTLESCLQKSVGNTAEAVTLIKTVRQMCAAGSFKLTKFASNYRDILETVPVSDQAQHTLNINLSQSTPSVEKALGVHWCMENDTSGFKIILKDRPFTRRGVPSTIGSIFDPLGLAVPFLLKGKRLLQHLVKSKKYWDDEIDDDERAVWEQWRAHLPSLDKIEVERCFKPADFGQPVAAELHHFSDASLDGYGQCSYLRLTNAAGQIHCALIIGKSSDTSKTNHCTKVGVDGNHGVSKGWSYARRRNAV
jgi:hypothetical protein